MCGIAGTVALKSRVSPDAVLAALAHRGPDGGRAVTAVSSQCTLMATRLAIVDPTPRAAQPMQTADGRFWIAFNGEIYNHRDLRRMLSPDRGWNTGCDTETVLHAFATWGGSCVSRLRGMFAFAVWDDRERTLFLARDPLGIKPLLYGWAPCGGFVFASEIGALLRMGVLPETVDLVAAAEVLLHGSIRQPRSLVSRVHMLPPGHTGTVARGTLVLSQYWKAGDFCRRAEEALSYEDAVERIREAVQEAAQAHAVADAPMGAFLSGGIDSRVVSASVQHMRTARLPTFTIGVGAHDEREHARAAARELGTSHHEHLLTEADWPALLEQFLDAIDQPSIDGANTLAACLLARRHVRLALSGLGADELFAGYSHFGILCPGTPVRARALSLLRVLARLPRVPGTEAAECPPTADDRNARTGGGAVSLLRMVRSGGRVAQWTQEVLIPADALVEADDAAHSAAASCVAATNDPVNQVSLFELEGYLRDTLLRDTDAVSMRVGMEVRPVLLDTPLVELALALPGTCKLREGRHKAVLKDAFPDALPQYVAESPKQGFQVPVRLWTPRACRDRWMAAFDTDAARALLAPGFRHRAQAACRERRPATQGEWAAFVLTEVIRRQRLSL